MPASLVPGTDYRLRLIWLANPAVSAYSAQFTVTAAPTFTITAPAAGAIWQAGGAPQNLVFTCANLPAPGQTILYLYKGGVFVRSLGTSPCQNGTNTRLVYVPASLVPGPDYQLRLLWLTNPAIGAQSAQFTVN